MTQRPQPEKSSWPLWGLSYHVTSACDLACLHCSVKTSPTPPPDELSTEEWNALSQTAAEIGVLGISLTGGEPLLRPDLEELVRVATQLHLNTQVCTNGRMLTQERLDSLISAGVRIFAVSLDGVTQKTHDKFRGRKGSFDHVQQSVSALVDRGVSLSVSTVINTLNLQEIPQIMDTVYSSGVKKWNLMRLYYTGRAKENEYLYPDLRDIVPALREVYQKSLDTEDFSIRYPSYPAVVFHKSIGQDAYETLKRKGKIEVCAAGTASLSIGSRGEIYPCVMSGKASIGNVRTDSLFHIWDSSAELEKLRNTSKKTVHPCVHCRMNDVCVAGCKALEFQVKAPHNVLPPDPMCSICFDVFSNETQN